MPSSLDEKLLGQWARVRLAHEAVMLEDATQVLRQARSGVRGHAPHSPESAEDSSMIHIGDLVQHHHAPPTGAGLGKLGAALLGAALTAGTGGMGLGLWQLLKPAAVPAVQTINKVLTRDTDINAGEAIVEPPKE